MRPAVTETSLYSYLVTRHTGRAVRLSIEERLADFDRHVLTVLDLRNVPLIDFSCADEVVAKLVVRHARDPGREGRRFFLFRGVAEHHLGPIESTLARQGLAIAAESVDGRPLLLGEIDWLAALIWHEVWRIGRATPIAVAATLKQGEEEVRLAFEELESRRLILPDGASYLSFQHALENAERAEPTA
jgi:hypothetical protein